MTPALTKLFAISEADKHSKIDGWEVALAQRQRAALLYQHGRTMIEALEGMLKHYVTLANSGDAGFWDPETESPVLRARALLTTLEQEALKS